MISGFNGNGCHPAGDGAPHITVVVAGRGQTQGQRILALIAACKMKRYEVAELADIPRSTFCHICNDSAHLNDERARKLADLFGVSVNFIRFGADEPPAQLRPPQTNGVVKVLRAAPRAAQPTVQSAVPSPNWRALEVARLVDQCPPKMQRAILAAVRAMVDTMHDGGDD